MGVPAYVKAALCSVHPRPAICQCQGASAVSMATPLANWGCERERVQASTSERRGQTSVSRDFHPRRRNATPGLFPPLLPLLLATTLFAVAIATLRHHSLDLPPLPTTRNRLSSRYLSKRARALTTFVTPEDATLILGGASGQAAANCFRH